MKSHNNKNKSKFSKKPHRYVFSERIGRYLRPPVVQVIEAEPEEVANQGITSTEYTSIQEAYNFYNTELFSGNLPECLITFQRRAHSYGYFLAQCFTERQVAEGTEAKLIDEIAMNPDGFKGRTDTNILSTLVHEMCHLWQQHFGEPPKRPYHNREWAAQMREVGLFPSTTGAEGGKQTGAKCSHYIIESGVFAEATQRFLDGGRVALHWQSKYVEKEVKAARNKIKYSCPSCGANVWGKPAMNVVCGDCGEEFEANS